MDREGTPISPDQLPEEARQYLLALQEQQDHPLVRDHFYMVTWLTLITSGKQASFFTPEFRDGLVTALVWRAEDGNWGSGGWIRVAHADADVTCPPSELTLAYFQSSPAFGSLNDVLDYLVSIKPEKQA